MDSLTQAALGATVALCAAGKQAASAKGALRIAFFGAFLGTLPDLDVLVPYNNPIEAMVYHRSFSHSVFVLLPLSWLLARLFHHLLSSSLSFYRVWFIVAMSLLTHPLLDAFTSYGTQIFWPMPIVVAISSIFIIDPIYTLPLLIALGVSLFNRKLRFYVCSAALVVSSLYLCWSLVAQAIVIHQVKNSVKEPSDMLVMPTPFNTVLWRVLIRQENGYSEGVLSLLDKRYEPSFHFIEKGIWDLPGQSALMDKLDWFTEGFLRFHREGNQVMVTDMRLGLAGYYPFRFVFSVEDDADYLKNPSIPYQLPRAPIKSSFWPDMWQRLVGDQSVDLFNQ
ncbi:hypothetical protein CI610_01530 [invertebrate metagenome]|uniref:Inner membrane protein n=1 Tax=invertebrate metagenome TaxID=1711999 RepID=A0A2H9T8G1_9ZZZZ